MTINLTLFDESTGKMYNVQVADSSATVAQLKQLVHQQTNHAVKNQRLTFEGNILQDHATLESCNIKDHDVLLYNVVAAQQQQQPSAYQQQQQRLPQQPSANAFGGWGGLEFQNAAAAAAQQQQQQLQQQRQANPLAQMDFTALSTEQVIQMFRANAAIMQSLNQMNPRFAQAILDNNTALVNQFLEPLRERQREDQLIRRLEDNPFDIEAQKLLEEMIQKRNIEENLEYAYEHNPESFASIFMLYINSEVNNIPLKAFVDSGAQMTVMGKSCAEKCNLMRLLDTRYHGVATGVGSAKILGRIHQTQLKIGNSFFNLTITVLDQDDMEFLIGLDMLRRWQACIDLKNNYLVVGDERVPFLGEHELPSKKRMESDLAMGSSPLPTSADQLPGAFISSPTPRSPSPAVPRSPIVNTAPQTATTNVPSSPILNPAPTSTATIPSSQGTDAQRQQLDILNQFLRTRNPQPQAQVQTQAPRISEDAIQNLMNMGFDREACVQALTKTGGNIEAALNLLLR